MSAAGVATGLAASGAAPRARWVRKRFIPPPYAECRRDIAGLFSFDLRACASSWIADVAAAMSLHPEAGSAAPDFTAEAVGGPYESATTVSLADLRGETVVLYFYPKDDTSGCTTQACALRDGWGEVSAKARVFGVSIDPIPSHGKFIRKYDLPFPLLSDPEKKIVEAYGVWVEKSMYGKKYMGTERSTFVIAPDGKIKAVHRKIAPAAHVPTILKDL
jgi:peroxiredoxin Q/BCP